MLLQLSVLIKSDKSSEKPKNDYYLDLGSSGAILEGSSPFSPTIYVSVDHKISLQRCQALHCDALVTQKEKKIDCQKYDKNKLHLAF